MELKASIDYKEFSEAFNKFPIEAAKEMRSALSTSARSIARDAKLHHRFKTKSGRLENSIQILIEKNGLSGIVYINETKAGYGKYVHEGTPPHIITAKNKKALAWVKGGVLNFVPKTYSKYWQILNATKPGLRISQKGYVNHPGTKPDRFLYDAGKRGEAKFLERIDKAIKTIIEKFK